MTAGLELLSKLLSSHIKGDLLVLFHKNPGLIDSMEGVASRIGAKARVIEADVRDLVDLGILKMRRVGSSEVILLDRARDRDLQEIIERHLRSLRTKDGG